MEIFASETRRVISAPYAVSLKNLDTALKDCDPDDLKVWVDSHPCQVNVLGPTVVNALEFCPFALSVVEQIAIIRGMRDAMLCARGSLLDTLLSSAMQDGNNFEKYSSVCLSLLSTPLPQEYLVPAQLVPFFLKCVDNATKRPSAESIRAIYALVSSGYNRFSELLSPAQKYNFHKQVGTFLTIQDRPDTNMLLILSLATLAGMDATHSNQCEDITISERQRLGTVEFFHGKKASKVLGLVSNIVIDIASKDAADGKVSIELIKMATVIVGTVSDSVKESWPSSRDAVKTQRLLEKVVKPGIDRRTMLEILRFAAALHSRSQQSGLQATIENLSLASYEQEKETGFTEAMFLPSALAEFFASSSSGPLITKVLRSTLRLASSLSTCDMKHHKTLQDRIQFIENLNKYVPRAQNLRRGILSPLLTNEFSNHIASFLSSVSTVQQAQPCPEHKACLAEVENSRSRLSMAVCTLILRSALYSQADTSISLDPSLATSLLEMQSQLSNAKKTCVLQCKTIAGHETSKLSLFEASATPQIRIASRDWRHSLVDGMAREAVRQHEFVISAVGDICRDLERRCEGIEQPLREEQQKYEALHMEKEHWKSKRAELEEDSERRQHAIEELEEEKQRLENKLDGAIGRTQDCLDRVKELEDLLQSAREQSLKTKEEFEDISSEAATAHRNALDELRSDAERAAMQNLAVLNARQNEIGELEEHNKRLESQINGVCEEVELVKQSKFKADERIAELEREQSELERALERERTVLTIKENKIEEMGKLLKEAETEQVALQEEIQQLEVANDQLEADSERRRIELQKTIEQADATKENLRVEQSAVITRLKLKHEDQLRELQNQLQEIRTESARERDAQYTENKALTKRINKLRTYQEEKEKEAQNLTRQLLSLMSGSGDLAHLLASNQGHSDPQPETPRLNPARALRVSLPAATTRRRTDALDASFESNASRPTPKRTKTKSAPRASQETQTKLGFKSAKPIQRGQKPDQEKENYVLRETEDIVEETPEEGRSEADHEPGSGTETDYGGGTGLMYTSTPKLGLSRGITTGRIAGGIGSEYDDTTGDF